MGSMFKKLAKWVVKHGLDELLQEIARDQARREAGAPSESTIPPAVSSLLSRPPTTPPRGG